MTKRTDKEQQFINYLLNKRDYVSAKDIANDIQSSPKTIYRLVKKINKESSNGEIISSRRGIGYRLKYSNFLSQHANAPVGSLGELTSVERRSHILRQLLVTSPEKHKIKDIFGQFYISESVISSDIHIIRDLIGKYQLKLHRRNEYLWITGDETNLRAVINELLIDDDDISISRFVETNNNIRQVDATFISRQIQFIENQLHFTIPYPYDVNLFSHLYILVERYHHVGSLVSNSSPDKLQMKIAEEEHMKMFRVLHAVMDNIGNYLQTSIPDSEMLSLYQYLNSSRVEENNLTQIDDLNNFSEKEQQITRYLIDKVISSQNFLPFNKELLFGSLVKHIKPMLNRLTNHIKIKNSLLAQIKLEYPTLFKTVSVAIQETQAHFKLPEINEDEIGFITVYFAQAMEQLRQTIKTVIVCTTGLGTAELLKTKIGNRFPELKIVQTSSATDLPKTIENIGDVQLIISTLNVPIISEIPELVVSALFSEEDQDRLSKLISQIKSKYRG